MKAKEERDQELFVLSAAADAYLSLDSSDSDGELDKCVDADGSLYIDTLIGVLDLQPGQVGELIDVICERRWRRAPEPYEYVKDAVRRRAGPRSVDLVCLTDLEVPANWEGDTVDDSDRLTLLDSRDNDAFWEELDAEHPSKGIHRVRSELKITEEPGEWLRQFTLDSITFVDWGEVARRAGLGEWGATALNYKAREISLYGALREQANDEDRKALRAAWARMERRLQAGIIKEILQKPEFSTG